MTWLRIVITLSFIAYLIYLSDFALAASIRPKTIKPVPKAENFTLYIVIPVLNEEQVIGQTLLSLLAEIRKLPTNIAPWIVTVNDDSDDQSQAIITALQADHPNILPFDRPPEEAHQGKGDVLNYAVNVIQHLPNGNPDHTILGILDADSKISAADLTKVIDYFTAHPDIAMLQGSVKIYNDDHWLTRMQDFKFVGVNSALQQVRETYDEGIASGNGQFVTLSMALANPWGKGLLEDTEFTLRAWLKGYKTAFSDDIVVAQSGVDKMRPLIRQRVRWCQGSMQCWRYLPALWRSKQINRFQKFDTTLWLVLPVLSTLIPITNIIALIIQVYNYLHGPAGWISPALVVILLLSFAICMAIGLEYHENMAKITPVSYHHALWLSVLYQAYLVLLIPVPYIALGRQILHMTKWDKTEHASAPETASQSHIWPVK
ncbi:glycosyltransferase [Schleiferilactobacillus harbinensis]|uniref:Glycosyltransferase n=1 Tax=Schleiferilactobacillus harbinensis DSM 16991 TaxID=1122147 RepID=A0A0R1XIT2_9LACO|nr:glycosyltransferase family 2 protein [Schleiferilactobacillus harbinensis]KRM29665.1 glycosyltransferase [Schleiferilactobacillus harbinensis DSM 16991]QFR64176.1 glycosyltransferase [Schleiferilactobacillus harbinensis]